MNGDQDLEQTRKAESGRAWYTSCSPIRWSRKLKAGRETAHPVRGPLMAWVWGWAIMPLRTMGKRRSEVCG